MVPKATDALKFSETSQSDQNSFLSFLTRNPTPFNPDYYGSKVKALLFYGNGAVLVHAYVVAIGHSIGRALGIRIPFFPKEVEASPEFSLHQWRKSPGS